METENLVLQKVSDTMLAGMKPSARRFSATTLRSTADWAGAKRITTDSSSVTLRPGLLFKILTLIIFGGATVLLIKEMIQKPGEKLGLMIFLACMFGTMLFLAIYQFFFNKKINYAILIDNAGIRIGTDHYTWKEIGATGILTKGYGRNKIKFLVIARPGGTNYSVYPLRLFVSIAIGGFPHKLSKYVECFKPVRV